MRTRLVALALLAAASGAAAVSRIDLVVCAPGYPGTTEQAQPTMDAFAAKAAKEAGWPRDSLRAVYLETADAGVAALREDASGAALVPLAFYVEYGARLGLEPRLLAVPQGGAMEVWRLVAGKGKVHGASSLGGWEVTGRAGFATGFVHEVVLEGFDLPPTATVTYTARSLSALRRAAAGEKVAVLLDGEQGAALGSLPFGSDLEVVFESRPLPAFLFCLVPDHLAGGRGQRLSDGLLRLRADAQGARVLEELRLVGFEAPAPELLERIRGFGARATGSGS